MPKCGVLNEPALTIISKHFETFDERGAQMVPKCLCFGQVMKIFSAVYSLSCPEFLRCFRFTLKAMKAPAPSTAAAAPAII